MRTPEICPKCGEEGLFALRYRPAQYVPHVGQQKEHLAATCPTCEYTEWRHVANAGVAR